MVIVWLMMVNNNLVGGWPTHLKNELVKVSWDDDIPNKYDDISISMNIGR